MFKSMAKAIFPAEWLGRTRRRIDWLVKYLLSPGKSLLRFTCNICGKRTSYPRDKMTREFPSCVHCGSSVRFRSIIHALSMELFGESLTLQRFPVRKDLLGIGMSDWKGYAEPLAEKLGYVNTYYHQEPLLDIASLDPDVSDKYDFIIATEVFEHVAQPISVAFANAHRLLKPGGVLIFSVPVVAGETLEHFPELGQYAVRKEGDNWILLNQTRDGQQQRYDRLTFHGGPGTTLEMRVFGKQSLLNNFSEAGFQQVTEHDEELDAFGIVWNPYHPEQAPYRPYIYGLDAPPWSARRL